MAMLGGGGWLKYRVYVLPNILNTDSYGKINRLRLAIVARAGLRGAKTDDTDNTNDAISCCVLVLSDIQVLDLGEREIA